MCYQRALRHIALRLHYCAALPLSPYRPLAYSPLLLFFFNDRATTEIYTLSLHDALPISSRLTLNLTTKLAQLLQRQTEIETAISRICAMRSEEHTSELQSHHDLVCRLLLEKKKTKQKT